VVRMYLYTVYTWYTRCTVQLVTIRNHVLYSSGSLVIRV
jgi:hypothetical protein